MAHGHIEAQPRVLDDALLEPVRAPRRVGRDDDLVRGKRAERVFERLERVAVPDLAARGDAGIAQAGKGLVEALLGGRPGTVLVRGPRPEPRVERGADEQHVLAHALGLAAEQVAQLVAADGLVRHDEDLPRGTVVVDDVRLRRPLDGHQIAVGVFAALVIVKSWPVVDNLTSKHQAMNTEYDRLAIVNTYGAFGSVGDVRHELVIEGSMDGQTWKAYELPCKPGALDRRPCVLGPYHRRLDWLIWFSAMYDQPEDPWILHLVWKLLDGDTTVRELLAVDPFDGKPPRWVRIRRFVYHLEPYGSPTWWTRDSEQLWLPPVSKDSAALRKVLAEFGWPSPSTHD